MILEKQESHFANSFSISIKYQLLIDGGRTRQFEGIGVPVKHEGIYSGVSCGIGTGCDKSLLSML